MICRFSCGQVSLLGGADESVKMSTSPTLLLDTRSAVQSTPTRTTTTTTTVIVTTAAEDPTTAAEEIVDDGWSDGTGGQEIPVDGAAAAEDVTAELTAPVAVAAGLGRAEWQLLAVAGAGAAVLLLLALVVAYRRTGRGSPALRKVVQHDDAECPPLLDYAPIRPLDFAKYLGEYYYYYYYCRSKSLNIVRVYFRKRAIHGTSIAQRR